MVSTSELDVEQAVIGACLTKPDLIDSVLPVVRSWRYFSDNRHQLIWRALIALTDECRPIDFITVRERLLESGKLEAGTSVYLSDLAQDGYFSTVNVSEYTKIISNRWQLRELGGRLHEIAEQSKRPEAEPTELIALTEKFLMDITSSNNGSGPVSFADTIEIQINEMLKPKDGEKKWVETRVADLNRKITGLFRGDMTIVAGPPSMGKTMFALDLCVFNHDAVSLYVSIDQTQWSICQRMITGITGIPKTRLLSGRMSDKEKDEVCLAGAEIARLAKFFVLEGTNETAIDIRSHARRVKRQHGLDILVIDHIQLLPSHRRMDNRNLEIAEASRILKAMAKELDVVLVVLSQLNRTYDTQAVDVEKEQWGIPRMAMLRESGALEQDANVVLFPWVPEQVLKQRFGENSQNYVRTMQEKPHLQNLAQIIIAKNKDGETGTVECRRDVERMRFYSESKQGAGRNE